MGRHDVFTEICIPPCSRGVDTLCQDLQGGSEQARELLTTLALEDSSVFGSHGEHNVLIRRTCDCLLVSCPLSKRPVEGW